MFHHVHILYLYLSSYIFKTHRKAFFILVFNLYTFEFHLKFTIHSFKYKAQIRLEIARKKEREKILKSPTSK